MHENVIISIIPSCVILSETKDLLLVLSLSRGGLGWGWVKDERRICSSKINSP
jgi:hypothetical protein